MPVEQRRGCGYRRAGGLYVRGQLEVVAPALDPLRVQEPGDAENVEWLPFCVDKPFTRSLANYEGKDLFRTAKLAGNWERYRAAERVGLMWVGAEHYTPASFIAEARAMDISKRVAYLPTTLKAGDPIALGFKNVIRATGIESGHPQSWHCDDCRDVPAAKAIATGSTRVGSALDIENPRNLPKEDPRYVSGVFAIFRMRSVEVILPASMASDPVIVAKCQDKGVRIISVPDNDRDHVAPGWKLPAFLRSSPQGELPLGGPEVQEAAAR